MATFGNTTTGSFNTNLGANNKSACKFTLKEGGNVTKISLYGFGGPVNVKCGIYSDNAGAPNALLGTTAEASVPLLVAWVDFTFATPLLLAAGNYWLALITEGAVSFRYSTGTVNQNAYNADAYADGFANPFGAPSYNAYELCIYATYSPVLTILQGPHCTTSPAAGAYPEVLNSNIPVTAIPESGYTFLYWLKDGVNVGIANPYTILMDGSHTLQPVYPNPPTSFTSGKISKTFGLKNYGTTMHDSSEQKTKAVSKFTLADNNVEVTKLSLFAEKAAAYNGKVKGVIYSDSAGSPGNLIAVTLESWAPYPLFPLIDLYFEAPVALDAGTYWLGFICDANFLDFAYVTMTNGRADTIDPYATGPSATFGAITWENKELCIYATYYLEKNLTQAIVGNTVTTVVTALAIRWQEKMFYGAGRIWVFYVDGVYGNAAGYYTSSVDNGKTWATPVALGLPLVEDSGENLQVLLDSTGTRIHVFARGLYYRSGLIQTDGTITWTAAWNNFWVISGQNQDFFAVLDSNDYPWITTSYGSIADTIVYINRCTRKDGVWQTASGYPLQISESETGKYYTNNFVVALSSGRLFAFFFKAGDVLHGKLWNGVSWGTLENCTTSKVIDQYPIAHETYSRGCVVDEHDNIHLVFQDNEAQQGTPSPFSCNLRYVKRAWPAGTWSAEKLIETDIPGMFWNMDGYVKSYQNASPGITLHEGYLRIFWVGQPPHFITYRRLDDDGFVSRPIYLVDEQTDTFPTIDADYDYTTWSTKWGYDGLINPFVKLFGDKFGLLWLTKSSTPGTFKLKFALQTFSYEYENQDTRDFERIKAHYKKINSSITSYDVTRLALTLGDRDAITGQYTLEYTDSTIEMVLIDKNHQKEALELGYFVQLDAIGYTDDTVRVYDRIQDGVGRMWLVQAVQPFLTGNVFRFNLCSLKEMPLYVE